MVSDHLSRRLRENSEGVALYGGEKEEQVNFLSRFMAVVNNYWKIMRRHKRLNWLTSGYDQLAVIFPMLMAAPDFSQARCTWAA